MCCSKCFGRCECVFRLILWFLTIEINLIVSYEHKGSLLVAIYLGVFMLWCLDTVALTAPCTPGWVNDGLVGVDPIPAPGGFGAKFGFPKFGAGFAAALPFEAAAALSNRFISLTDPDTVCASSCVCCGCVLPIEL